MDCDGPGAGGVGWANNEMSKRAGAGVGSAVELDRGDAGARMNITAGCEGTSTGHSVDVPTIAHIQDDAAGACG